MIKDKYYLYLIAENLSNLIEKCSVSNFVTCDITIFYLLHNNMLVPRCFTWVG